MPIKADDILPKFMTIKNTENQAVYWDNQNVNITEADVKKILSHRPPIQICFSQKTNYTPGLIRSMVIYVQFNASQLVW